MHLMSGLAAWMAEWSIKPATFTPKFVVLQKDRKLDSGDLLGGAVVNPIQQLPYFIKHCVHTVKVIKSSTWSSSDL